jgi:chromosome segregation ATPase
MVFAFGWVDQPAEPAALPLREPYLDWVDQGRSTCGAIEEVVARLSRPLHRVFAPLSQQARELVRDLDSLARSAQQIDDYLFSEHGQSPAAEAERLQGELATEEDPVIRARLEQALHAIQDALADQQELRTLRERLEADATCINASLQSVLSEVVKQQHAHLETARQEYGSAAERLQSVKSHVEAIQQVVSTRLSSLTGRW